MQAGSSGPTSFGNASDETQPWDVMAGANLEAQDTNQDDAAKPLSNPVADAAPDVPVSNPVADAAPDVPVSNPVAPVSHPLADAAAASIPEGSAGPADFTESEVEAFFSKD